MESNHQEIICPLKNTKKGPLKQIVPGYPHLKNAYTLLWDMPSNDGYIKVTAVIQKFFDQAISGNWSYNPENYEGNEVPTSEMAKDLLTTYKYGWKTSYYQNTYDAKKDGDEPAHPIGWYDEEERKSRLESLLADVETADDDCESCKI